MIRPLFYEAALFLLPFFLYALWLAWKRVNPARRQAWENAPILSLLLAALLSTAIGLGVMTHYDGAPPGSAYVPAHVEDGKLVGPEMR
jgi:hypothetical protein